jgi:hypothetical protein
MNEGRVMRKLEKYIRTKNGNDGNKFARKVEFIL